MTTIRIIDFETTSADADAKVIEYGYSDYDTELKTVSDPISHLFHVDFIPPESRNVHHISLEDIPAANRTFDAFADVLMPAETAAISFFAAHNAKFEMQFLGEMTDKHMLCTYKAALRIWPEAPSHSNGVLRYWLEDQGKISPDSQLAYPPHRAGPDSYITANILKALFADGATGRDMVGWTREPALLPRCPIGNPWRGKPWSGVDAGFLNWMVNKSPDMDPDLKWNADRELKRRASL